MGEIFCIPSKRVPRDHVESGRGQRQAALPFLSDSILRFIQFLPNVFLLMWLLEQNAQKELYERRQQQIGDK